MTRLLMLTILCVALAACTTKKNLSVTTRPPDAEIRLNGQPVGRGSANLPLLFENNKTVHRITVARPGFKDQTFEIPRDFSRESLMVELKPQTRRVSFTVTPVPAVISVDKRVLSPDPANFVTVELEFTVDAQNQWIPRTVTAERTGFQPAEITVNFTDRDSNYQIQLEPLKKDLKITTNPTGAVVYLDNQRLGTSPVTDTQRAFAYDVERGRFVPMTLRVEKPGFDPIEQSIAWDNGRSDYHVDLLARTKTVRFITDPPGAEVKIEGATVTVDDAGRPTATLQFPPINDQGDLRTWSAVVSKKTEDSEWTPETITIAWEDGKTDYPVTLEEILTRPVELLISQPQRGDEGWRVVPKWVTTIAMKDTTEGARSSSPLRLTRNLDGPYIDSLTVSPDGKDILFTILDSRNPGDLRSKLVTVRTDGTGGARYLTDGRSLDITPSYTPDGSEIVFSSNRAGRRQNIWKMSAMGAPGITQLTSGETNDLWPTIDSEPRPRLFYQAFVDTRPDPRLFMTHIGTTLLTDLTLHSGAQPRINPKGDSILFTAVNERTGKRDIMRLSDKGGVPENLTNTLDIDEFDPVWNADGSKIAYVSDRSMNDKGQRNYDIWLLDLKNPNEPYQVTTNGSWDDRPVFDPSENHIYFRSNRGGQWAIWRIPLR